MSEQEAGDGLYNTADFYTAALLICRGHKIEKITTEKSKHKKDKKSFYFTDSEELQADLLSYMNRDLEGNLRDFRDAIERVKDIVHS